MKEVIKKINDFRKQDLEKLVDGSISKDPKTIVNAFNEHFYRLYEVLERSGPNSACENISSNMLRTYVNRESDVDILPFLFYIKI